MENPPESWYNPPDQHEIDLCFDCHDQEHYDREWWAKHGCILCEEELEKEKLNVGD